MNAGNVIPLGAPRAVAPCGGEKRVAPNPVRVRFDSFELDEANARLLREGVAIDLAPTPFAVLCALVRRPGSLLTTNGLLDEVWGHRYVTDSVLRTAISQLRAALGDRAREPRYVETVSRRGYRFLAATEAIAAAASVRATGLSGQPSFTACSTTPLRLCGARDIPCRHALACTDTSRHEAGAAVPPPAFATPEQTLYAHELKLQVRSRMLGLGTPSNGRWSIGAD